VHFVPRVWIVTFACWSALARVGAGGQVCPPPHGWQGICPTHPGYRQSRMDDFRRARRDFEIDGIWLDYHHSRASWERAEPDMPDTCFCRRCVDRFAHETNTQLPHEPLPQLAQRLLGQHADAWVQWRCDVFTDWVREFRSRHGLQLGLAARTA